MALGLLGSGLLATLAWAGGHEAPLADGAVADRVEVEKSRRELTLWRGGEVLKRYRIALGREPVGTKRREGDLRTPEGRYRIAGRLPGSGYHRALHVSYPDARDLEDARRRGEPPGGRIMLHGLRNGLGWLGRLHRLVDWTAGCIALTDREIDELWRAVPDGTPIEIRP